MAPRRVRGRADENAKAPARAPLGLSIVWIVALVAVFAPLAVRKDRSIDR